VMFGSIGIKGKRRFRGRILLDCVIWKINVGSILVWILFYVF